MRNAIQHIIKPFDVLNTIPLRKTKTWKHENMETKQPRLKHLFSLHKIR